MPLLLKNSNMYFLDYIVVVLITTIILKVILRLGKRDTAVVFFSCFLMIFVPSYRMIRHVYYFPLTCIMIIIAMVTIWLSKLHIRIRIGLTVLLCWMYYRTFLLVYGCVGTCIRSIMTPSSRRTDRWLLENIDGVYKRCGLRLVTNFGKLPSKPTILVASYCRDRMENVACILVPRKLAIMMQIGFKYVNMHNIINKPIYVRGHGKGNFDYICDQIKIAHDEGNDIFVYINSPSYYDYMGRYSSGIYHIAKKLGISITPVAFDYIDSVFGTIPNQNYCIKVGESFYVTTKGYAKCRTRKFHEQAHREFKKNKYNFRFKL